MSFDITMLGDYSRIALQAFAAIAGGSLIVLWATGLLRKTVGMFFGQMEDGEIEKFSLLSLTFGIIVGAYWMMRSLKDPIFRDLVGMGYQPRAKIMAPFVLAFVLFLYSFLVDRFKKHRLFLIVCSVYATLFAICGFVYKANLPVMDHFLVNWIPGRVIGWLYYVAVESFGGIIVGAVFWAFVTSTTKTESAKKGFPLIFVGAQVGNFFGPAVNLSYAKTMGNGNLMLLAAALVMLVPAIIELYMKVIPAHLHESDDSGHKKKKTGAWEGVRLITTKPYLMGVFVISTVYEVVGTIIDYQFKVLSGSMFPGEQFTMFTSFYAMCAALVALAFTIVGTGFFIKKFGVRACLLGYPVMVGATVIGLYLKPMLGAFFAAMIVVKAFSYALNNPIKELLYLPTSKDVKYKAKGLIDGFGGKSSKAVGASITGALAGDLGRLLSLGGMISLGIVGFWTFVAVLLGMKYDKMIKDKEIIE